MAMRAEQVTGGSGRGRLPSEEVTRIEGRGALEAETLLRPVSSSQPIPQLPRLPKVGDSEDGELEAPSLFADTPRSRKGGTMMMPSARGLAGSLVGTEVTRSTVITRPDLSGEVAASRLGARRPVITPPPPPDEAPTLYVPPASRAPSLPTVNREICAPTPPEAAGEVGPMTFTTFTIDGRELTPLRIAVLAFFTLSVGFFASIVHYAMIR